MKTMKDEIALTIIVLAVIFACAAAIAGVINVHDEHGAAAKRHLSAAAAAALYVRQHPQLNTLQQIAPPLTSEVEA